MEQKVKYRVESQTILLWLVFMILFSTFALIRFLLDASILEFILIISFSVICIFSIYLINKLRFKRFHAILQQLTSKSITYDIKKDFILIKKNSYKMKPLYQSSDVKINHSFEKSSVYYCISDSFIILFIEITEFVYLKHYCKPILFSKENENPFSSGELQKIDKYQQEFIESDIIISSKSFPDKIHSIRISSEIIKLFILKD